ncbi:MAG: tetratricopeptide repeat protein [Candidatus Methylomirabilales bacterium]
MSLIQDALKKVQGGPSVRPPLGGVQYGRGRSSRSKWPWGLISASVAAIALLFFVVKVPGLLLGRRLPAKPVRSVPAAERGAQPTAPLAVSPAEPPSTSPPAGALPSPSPPVAAHRVPSEAVPPIRATLPVLEERVVSPVQVGPPDGRPPRVVEKPDPTPPVEGDALSSAPQETAPKRAPHAVVDGKDRYHFNMGLFYQQQGQYAQAFAAYQKTVELNPFHVEAYNNLGVLYKELGEVEKAIQHYRRALAIDPNYVKAYNNLGVVLIRQEKLTEATAQFEHALELNPKNLESYTNLGVIYRRLSRIPEAIRAFESALSIDPEHAESHYNLAILLEGQGRIAEALAHYRRFVASAEPRHRSVVARVIAHIQLLGQGTAGPSATRKLLAE